MDFLKKLFKTIPKLVQQAEDYMLDGTITADERKKIVLDWVNTIAETFGFKLKWIHRVIINLLINWAAQKLPSKDITIPAYIKKF